MKHAYNIIFYERNSFDCKFSSLFFFRFSIIFYRKFFVWWEFINMILRNVILSVFCHLRTVKDVTLTIRSGSLFYYYVFQSLVYYFTFIWWLILSAIFCTNNFEDAREVFRSHKSKKDRQCNGQNKGDNMTKINKTLHRKLEIEQQDPH